MAAHPAVVTPRDLEGFELRRQESAPCVDHGRSQGALGSCFPASGLPASGLPASGLPAPGLPASFEAPASFDGPASLGTPPSDAPASLSAASAATAVSFPDAS